MKTVQMPRGTTEEENAVLGAEGQLRVDLSRGTVRVHDGARQGGYELPNVDIVRALVAAGPEGSSGTAASVTYYSTQAELVAAVPRPNSVAIVGESGLEDIYVWRAGAGDGGTVTSAVDGNWHRLDSIVAFYVRLYRAACINMQFGGAVPGANQDITAWLDGIIVKLWNGAAYVAATPVLFTRLLSKIGNYAGTIILPSRLEAALVAAADLNLVLETGWCKSSAADANAPSAVVSPVFTFFIDANTAYQEFYVQTAATRDSWRRGRAAGVWGSWVFCPGSLDTRLAASTTAVADLNTAIDTGWYNNLGAATNAPVAETGTFMSIRYNSTNGIQHWFSTANNKSYYRRYVASVWQAWVQVYPADVTNATGTLPRANVGITTISQAEAEAGTATTDRIFTAERVKQAIQIWWATSANFLQNTANKVLTAASVWSAGTPVTLGGAMSGNVAMDFNTGLNFYGTTAGNIVFNSLSNLKDGQAGTIEITLGGAHTVGYNTASFETPRTGGLQIATGKNVIAYKKLQNGKCLLNNVSPTSG